MRYQHLTQHPAVFLKMTGLRVPEFDTLVRDLLPAFAVAETQRLQRPNRQRELGVDEQPNWMDATKC